MITIVILFALKENVTHDPQYLSQEIYYCDVHNKAQISTATYRGAIVTYVCVCSCALGEDEKFFGLVTPLPLPVITPEPCNPWRMQMPPGEYYCS